MNDGVDRVLETLSRGCWTGSAGRGEEIHRRALALRRAARQRMAALALLGAGVCTGLGFAAAALLHTFPLSMEVQHGGRVIYSGDLDVRVENGQIAPIVVETDHGPLEIPISLPPGVTPESVIGMEMKVEVKFTDDEKEAGATPPGATENTPEQQGAGGG
jgi:hypothetical protein